MDPLILLLIIVTSILTVLLVIVGVQVVMILKEIRSTLGHVNKSLEMVDNIIAALSKPVSGLTDIAAGVKTGLKITESFVSWLSTKNQDKNHGRKSEETSD
jgi:hypothetical protein